MTERRFALHKFGSSTLNLGTDATLDRISVRPASLVHGFRVPAVGMLSLLPAGALTWSGTAIRGANPMGRLGRCDDSKVSVGCPPARQTHSYFALILGA